jgi:hypothetical protein
VGGTWPGKAGSTNDTVTFDGSKSNDGVLMGSAPTDTALTIATLTMNGYTGTVQLEKNLTLNSGGSMDNGKILQGKQTPAATLTIAGGTFTCTGGDINYTSLGVAAGTLSISAGAEFDFANAAGTPVHFGDNLNNSGTLKLDNGGSVELDYTPTITNASTGKILITTNNLSGIIKPAGNAVVTIQNSGTIQKTNDAVQEYDIVYPVNNRASGAIVQVDAGTLRFTGGDPSTGIGVTQSAGVIQVSAGAALEADAGVSQSGGTIKTTGAGGTAAIVGALTMSGGLLQVGDGTPTITTLALGSFTWSGGSVNLYYDKGTATNSKITCSSATVTPATTTLNVSFVGTGGLPASFNVITATGAISAVASTNNVSGYTASISSDSHDYVETKNP